MHIVQCLTHSILGGGQQVVYTLVKTLLKLHPEIQLTVVLPSKGIYVERFKAFNVNVLEFPFNTLSPINVVKAKRLFQQLNADVIHSHGKGAGLYARAVRLPSQKVRRIHSYHGFHLPTFFPAKQVYLFQESHLLNKTDKLVLVSQSEANEVSTYFPSAKEKIGIIQNVVEYERSNNSLPKKLQDFLDANKNSFIVTMIGRNDPIKNYPLAFKAMEKVLSNSEDTVFVVIGLTEHEGLVKRLKNTYSKRVCVIESVESSFQVLQRSALLFVTSRKEGSPLTVREAFCCEKPVVGTNVGGIKDIVVDGYNGKLCPENPNLLADAILQLHSKKETYYRLSAGAKESAGKMDVEAWAEAYYQVYVKLLS
jgi:glycosyltransferase involved in cell wall biosynthesis